MAGGAQLSVTEMRSAARHRIDYRVLAEHRQRGDMQLHVSNISAHGLMIDGAQDIVRGDRLIIRLPALGRIEAYCIWVAEDRAGFQFERIIRLDDFSAMMAELQPKAKLRRRT